MSERREGRCLLCLLKMLDFGVGVQEASKLSPRDLIAGQVELGEVRKAV